VSAFGFDQEVTVTKVFSQMEGGTIFTSVTPNGEVVRVKYQGRDVIPLPGDTFHVKGQWGNYTDKYRRIHQQVDSKIMKRRVVVGELLGPWLQRIPNIGPERGKRLLDRFGHDLVTVLKDAKRMAEVAGTIEPNKPALAARLAAQLYAAMVSKSAAEQMKIAEAEFLSHLEKIGLREPRTAFRLWRFMAGPNASERLLRNPYVPAHLMDWSIADRLGKRLLRESEVSENVDVHPARLMGALASVWRELIGNGDSAASEQCVREMLVKRAVDPDLALENARLLQHLYESGDLIRAPGAAWIEDEVVRAFARIESTPPSVHIPHDTALDKIIRDGEMATDLRLTDEQRDALRKLLHHPIAVLQGGAGTGKTTVMKVLAYCWERLGGNVVMGALAGKAALQLSRGASSHNCPRLAYTLARLIGMLEEQERQTAKASSPRQPDVTFDAMTLLVIDEAGMMDTPTLHRILTLLPSGARLLLAGDDGQLFPIGFGKVFHDLVVDGTRVAKLTKILRQADDSVIPLVANQIHSGITPNLLEWRGEAKGVFTVHPNRRERVQRELHGVDFLVVAALRNTVAGINETEADARRDQNKPTRRLGPLATVAVDDPIVMTVNRYKHGLFNGLLGVVTDIYGERVQAQFDGESEPRDLPEEAEGDVELAYAITCHKAQGSSANTAMVLVEATSLATREWLYTALTRARQLVLLVVGNTADLERAVESRTMRTTGFRVCKAKGCRGSVE
jgi:exodeoxyribonuclease V alpha subunit